MKLLFDVGDMISFRVKGIVHSYSKSADGDCYTIETISCEENSNNRIYISSDALIESNARIESEECNDDRSVGDIMDDIKRDAAEFYRDMEREIALLKMMEEEKNGT